MGTFCEAQAAVEGTRVMAVTRKWMDARTVLLVTLWAVAVILAVAPAAVTGAAVHTTGEASESHVPPQSRPLEAIWMAELLELKVNGWFKTVAPLASVAATVICMTSPALRETAGLGESVMVVIGPTFAAPPPHPARPPRMSIRRKKD